MTKAEVTTYLAWTRQIADRLHATGYLTCAYLWPVKSGGIVLLSLHPSES